MSFTPVKGNGTLYGVTDADEYDRRTGGWFKEHFPETYMLQKTMPRGREHPQFKAFKDMALALGKSMREGNLNKSVTNTPQDVAPVSLTDRLKKAVAHRKAAWKDIDQ